jgi:hypothetical protein
MADKKEPSPMREAYARRRLAMGRRGKPGGLRVAVPPGPGTRIGHIASVDMPGASRNTHQRMASVSSNKVGGFYSPTYDVARAISDALDPVKAPGKVRTLADMTPEERETLTKRYAKP